MKLQTLIKINKKVQYFEKQKASLTKSYNLLKEDSSAIDNEMRGLMAPYDNLDNTNKFDTPDIIKTFLSALMKYSTDLKKFVGTLRVFTDTSTKGQPTNNKVINDILKHIIYYHRGYAEILLDDFDSQIKSYIDKAENRAALKGEGIGGEEVPPAEEEGADATEEGESKEVDNKEVDNKEVDSYFGNNVDGATKFKKGLEDLKIAKNTGVETGGIVSNLHDLVSNSGITDITITAKLRQMIVDIDETGAPGEGEPVGGNPEAGGQADPTVDKSNPNQEGTPPASDGITSTDEKAGIDASEITPEERNKKIEDLLKGTNLESQTQDVQNAFAAARRTNPNEFFSPIQKQKLLNIINRLTKNSSREELEKLLNTKEKGETNIEQTIKILLNDYRVKPKDLTVNNIMKDIDNINKNPSLEQDIRDKYNKIFKNKGAVEELMNLISPKKPGPTPPPAQEPPTPGGNPTENDEPIQDKSKEQRNNITTLLTKVSRSIRKEIEDDLQGDFTSPRLNKLLRQTSNAEIRNFASKALDILGESRTKKIIANFDKLVESLKK